MSKVTVHHYHHRCCRRRRRRRRRRHRRRRRRLCSADMLRDEQTLGVYLLIAVRSNSSQEQLAVH